MWRSLLLAVALLILPPDLLAQPADFDEPVRRIASELRCIVCQNLSVADSDFKTDSAARGVEDCWHACQGKC